MLTFVTFASLASTAIITLLLPRLQARRTPFGINIPAEKVDNDDVRSISRTYVRRCALTSVPIVAACTAATALHPSAWPTIIGSTGLVFVLFFFWQQAHNATHTLVQESGWLSDRPRGMAGRVVGAQLNRAAVGKISWHPYLLATIVLIATTAILIAGWDQIPESFPTHFNASGQADGYTAKGPGVFFAQYLGGGMLLLSIGISWIITAGQVQVRQTKGAKDRARFDAIMNITEKSTAWLMGLMTVMISTIGVVLALPNALPLPKGNSSAWIALIVIVSIGGSLVMVAYSIVAGDRAAARTEPDLDDPDEYTVMDKSPFRKAGIFYYNPDDPAYFVEKAMGAGIDFNYAHWPAKVFLAAVAASIVLPVVLVHYS